MAAKAAKARKSPTKSVVELVLTVAVAVGLAWLIQQFIVKPYKIPSGSMIPTLSIDQRVLTNKMINKPSVGDIVVFHPPVGADDNSPIRCENGAQGGNPGNTQPCDQNTPQQWSGQTFIKRVVAGPGDTVQITDGHVYRNGVQEKDSYINSNCQGSTNPPCSFRKSIKIPAGEWYMMGDNRGNSDDSRYWGPVPTKWIFGVAFFTYWPPDRIGFL